MLKLHLNDPWINALARSFKGFLNSFDSVLLQNCILIESVSRNYGEPSSFSVNSNVLKFSSKYLKIVYLSF